MEIAPRPFEIELDILAGGGLEMAQFQVRKEPCPRNVIDAF